MLSKAQGDLMVYPKRIVFDNSQKTQELNLSNNGKDSARYVLSVIQIRMKTDGGFETITTADSSQRFAEKYFRFFPRQVVLAPGESQTVKIQPIRGSELVTGEYRSHLYLRSESEKLALGEVDSTTRLSSISVSITPVLGISVPIIIKSGKSDTKVLISDLSFSVAGNTKPVLTLKFIRTGNMSVYGDILVNHVSASGKITKVGVIQGAAIYAPTPGRQFHLPLDLSKTALYHSGKLQVVYSSPAPKPETFAEAEILLK
jgi:hypothetical protein